MVQWPSGIGGTSVGEGRKQWRYVFQDVNPVRAKYFEVPADLPVGVTGDGYFYYLLARKALLNLREGSNDKSVCNVGPNGKPVQRWTLQSVKGD